MHPVKIIFLGICLLTNMTVGNQNGKRVILPHLKGETNMQIGSHTAFVAFPAGAFGGSQGMGTLATFQNKLTQNIPYDWFPLDGDEVTISLAPDPFVVDKSYGSSIVKIHDHCASFTAVSPDYAFGTDPAKKAAQIDLMHGRLFTQLMFAGMIATRLEANADGPVVITARSWSTGLTRSVTVNSGDIWIGNMKDDFFSPDADPNTPDQPGMNHFLAYYRMASTANNCNWHPPMPPAESHRNYDVGCSNSNYP